MTCKRTINILKGVMLSCEIQAFDKSFHLLAAEALRHNATSILSMRKTLTLKEGPGEGTQRPTATNITDSRMTSRDC